ncbi:hypothetical protein GCM10023143_24830 [Compostibacter hankyongensis]|uniref:Dehydrogenase n=2 Tax=Compostibacter hankyongensis TaxID=1007089 RepID=A0ABP8FZC0_9BACT
MAVCCWACSGKRSHHSDRVELLFLGHQSIHHNSSAYEPILASYLFPKGINITYTEDPGDLNEDNLSKYDGLIIYANHDSITPAQEKALTGFVKGGKAFIPIHCASFCFQNSPEYIRMVGGQFKSHDTGTFAMTIVKPDHPVMQGFRPFETWDETYVHDKLNPENIVLTERVEGAHHEPYTWVRNYGKGRVFYTAYGHDERTWQNPGFLQLLERGIFWALSDEAREKAARVHLPRTEHVKAPIPNYEKRDPPPQLQKPLPWDSSRQLMQVPVDFEIKLFAAEPDIINPIAMAWDEKGRLWVIETTDYPNNKLDDKSPGDDRIKICEDTDGDGRADKFTVFADKLNIPTSLTFANGGVVVSQAPDFLFFKDTNGDDRADVCDTIFHGWGTFDTHAGPSNLRYGLDNHLWGTVGYSGFDGTVDGQHLKFSQGVYRFTPDGRQLDFLAGTSNNTWGLGFSETFDVLLSTANNTHSAYYSVPDHYFKNHRRFGQGVTKIDGHYEMQPITPNLRQVDVHGGFTAAAGHNLYTARSFPQEYWNRIAFVCEPTGRLIHRAVLEPKGSGFAEHNGGNLLASADDWVAPVQASVGPDGAVWFLDWYNFIVQHNPTPEGFETGKGNAYINPWRDHSHGRIYRIVYKFATPPARMELSASDPEGLLKGLENDNMFWRMTAQRLLVSSGNKSSRVLNGLYRLVNNTDTDAIGLNSPAVHALWTLKGLGVLDSQHPEALDAAVKALRHPAAGVRKAAVQVLPRTGAMLEQIEKSGILQDPDLHTRLAAFLALADMPASPGVGEAVYKSVLQPVNAGDPWLPDALLAAAITQREGFIRAFKAGAASRSPADSLAENIRERLGPEAGDSIAAAVHADMTIQLKVVQHDMKYDRKTLYVKAGKKIALVFENPDFMQHNLLILQPGSLEKVGAAADELARDPKGAEKNYVPDIPEVLAATPLVNPGGSFVLVFTAPEKPGDYPFACTFPGHWRVMNGILKVEP